MESSKLDLLKTNVQQAWDILKHVMALEGTPVSKDV